MDIDFEWSVRFKRESPRGDRIAEVVAVGRDFEENYGYVKIGGGWSDPADWDVDEAWWLWRRLPVAIALAYVGLAQWKLGEIRKWVAKRLRRA